MNSETAVDWSLERPIEGYLYRVREVGDINESFGEFNGVIFDRRVGAGPYGDPRWMESRAKVPAGDIILIVSVRRIQPMWTYAFDKDLPKGAADLYWVISFLHGEKHHEDVHVCAEGNVWSTYFELVGPNSEVEDE